MANLKEDENGCWIWQKHPRSRYGNIKFGPCRTTISTHRAAYRLWVGSIPDGLSVLHECDVTKCCNPEHLFLGTAKDNAEDMLKKGRHWVPRGKDSPHYKHGRYAEYESTDQQEPRTHCPYRHEMTPENTYVHKGQRCCRSCELEQKREQYRRKKSEGADR